jgi:hypothetical protein
MKGMKMGDGRWLEGVQREEEKKKKTATAA